MSKRFADHTITIDFTFPELEALLKTVGIGIQNLLTKLNRIEPYGSMYESTNDDLLSLVSVQQALMEALVECSVDEH
jgi:hypothetical protein